MPGGSPDVFLLTEVLAPGSLLAMVLVNKFLLHQPLNRQSKTFAREGGREAESEINIWCWPRDRKRRSRMCRRIQSTLP